MKIAALSGKAACVRRSGSFQYFRSPSWISISRYNTNFRPPIPIPLLLALALCFFGFIEFCFYSLRLFSSPLSPEKPVFYAGVHLFFTSPFPLALIYSNQQQQLSSQVNPRLDLVRAASEPSATFLAAFIPAATDICTVLKVPIQTRYQHSQHSLQGRRERPGSYYVVS